MQKPKEPLPDECCGSGCARCVWDYYYERLEKYQVFMENQQKEMMNVDNQDPNSSSNLNISCPIEIKFLTDQKSESTSDDSLLKCKIIDFQEFEFTSHSNQKKMFKLKLQPNRSFPFQPGDSILIWKRKITNINMTSTITTSKLEELSKKLTKIHSKDSIIEITQKPSETPRTTIQYPKKWTLIQLLSNYVDLFCMPTPEFMHILKQYNPTVEFPDDLIPNLIIIDILLRSDIQTPAIPILLYYAPKIEPRTYSIASSPLINKETCDFELMINLYEKGVCSSWLHKIGTEMRQNTKTQENEVYVTWMSQCNHKHISQDSQFVLPQFRSNPLIFVCTGTGYAPIRSFLQHRRMESLYNPGLENGVICVYYGACNEKHAELISNEMNRTYLNESIVSKFEVSYSESTDPTKKKEHVNDRMVLNANELGDLLLNKQAILYVCGNPHGIGKSYQEALLTIFQNHFSQLGNPISILEQLKSRGQIRCELWQQANQ